MRKSGGGGPVISAVVLTLAAGTGWCQHPAGYNLAHTLPQTTGFVNSLAVSPDGKSVAVAGDNGIVTLWSTASGERTGACALHAGAVYAVAFDRDGRALATGSLDGVVRIWDLESNRERLALSGHTGWINAIAFTSNGRVLVSAGRDSTVRLWDLEGGKLLRTIADYPSEVFTAAASPDGRWIASDKGDSFSLRDAATGKQVAGGAPGQWGINALGFSPDSGSLLTSGYDGKLWVWDIGGNKLAQSIPVDGGPVISLAVRPDGLLVALLCSGDKSVKLLDTRSWGEAARLPGVSYPSGSVAFSGDGSILAAGGGDSPVRIWRRGN